MSRHIKLTIEYDGTAYHGWQIQPQGRTIQGELEGAVGRMFGRPARITAAGRTDAGVHASGQVVSFYLPRDADPAEVRRGLDALTPPDIVVRSAERVADDFDPRRCARSRTYVYRIWNGTVPSVFHRRFAWHERRRLDTVAMQAAASVLVGEHDFSSFRAAGCDAAHPVRRVYRSDIEHDGDLVSYTIEATAFLRHMVRNIVGSLVEVGLGQRSAAEFTALLAARDRNRAGATAPARGLCLLEVRYDV